ncbi:MAG: segregation ATPase FtsK/SpoIIIE, family [Actinomycetota bacterium]|nr:segregation ATPase FtsK/SpoIIIE, family [Actinomycetota bacterium]
MDVVIGVGDLTLGPVAMVFRDRDHAIVSGPTRSGKSTALRTIAASLARWHPEVNVTALGDGSTLADVVAAADELGPHVLLVDDADRVDDPGGHMAALLSWNRADVHVVAAGRTDGLRGAYGHWTRDLRRSRLGLALRPEPDDGDLFSTSFPRRARIAPVVGRGYLVVDGDVEVVQVATP